MNCSYTLIKTKIQTLVDLYNNIDAGRLLHDYRKFVVTEKGVIRQLMARAILLLVFLAISPSTLTNG